MEKENKTIFESFEENGVKVEKEFPIVGKEFEGIAAVAEEEIAKTMKEPVLPEFGELSNGSKYAIKFENEPLDADDNTIKVFTISNVEMLKPALFDAAGKPIEPISLSKSDSTKKGYESKLAIYFEDSNYRALLPNIKWFLNVKVVKDEATGIITKSPILTPGFRIMVTDKEMKTDPQFIPMTTKLYYMFCKTFEQEVGKLSKKSFIDGLVGKKVVLTQRTGIYENSTWHRIEIAKFVK